MTEVPAEIIVSATPEDFACIAAEWIAHHGTQAVKERDVFTLGLSGGSTPLRVFDLLAEPGWRARVPWRQTRVFWCDERCVPPDHPDSNYHQAWEHLLSKVDIPPEQIHRIEGEDPDPEAAAARYAALLPARFDLLVLGIGEDGHTASLFPGSSMLFERMRKAVFIANSPKPPPCRITITPPVIENARHLLMLATGMDKARAVARALASPFPIDEIPARLARWGAWLLDRSAAAELPEEICRAG
ncbi:MAG: 6-phosphogluconolactonase [Armatimonadota bacterium]